MDGLRDELICWGRDANRCRQGHAYRLIDRRYWSVYWNNLFYTLERDGPMQWDGVAWRSMGGAVVSIPYAVIDDYGNLMAVAWMA